MNSSDSHTPGLDHSKKNNNNNEITNKKLNSYNTIACER